MGLWVFFLRSLLFATSFFISISEKCSYIRDCSCIHAIHVHVNVYPVALRHCQKRMSGILSGLDGVVGPAKLMTFWSSERSTRT